jgi:hypothetical protein
LPRQAIDVLLEFLP